MLRIWHLGVEVGGAAYDRDGVVALGPLDAGGFGVEAVDPAGNVLARTAVHVQADDCGESVCRYGFVANYRPGRDLAPVADLARRLHLTAIQCYDWAFRHADLMGGGETYADALGNPVSLATVRRLVAAAHAVGADAIGYAAVYGVGAAEWPAWADLALLDAEGSAYALGDFLRVVDPAAPRWLAPHGRLLTEVSREQAAALVLAAAAVGLAAQVVDDEDHSHTVTTITPTATRPDAHAPSVLPTYRPPPGRAGPGLAVSNLENTG